MANPEHLQICQQGTEAWNRWRRLHRAIQPDLSHADLRRVNLRAANLNSVNLSYADLEGANLGRAYLEAAELRGATPRRAHFFEADLSHADLSDMDLREAQLWRSRLEGADLRRARLAGADLRHSDLTGADLRHCDLEGANLSGVALVRADLRGARLGGADLGGARLCDSRLSGADLTGARMAATAISAVDLSRVRGLASVRHARAASVGTDTLDLTAAGLRADPAPTSEIEAFLRHAGVQESYLDLFRQSLRQPSTVSAVFLRYSFADRAFAERLYGALQERGLRCWLDEHPMLPGDDLEEGHGPRPELGERLLLCCSRAALTSWWFALEVERGQRLERERGDAGPPLWLAIDADGYFSSGRWQGRRRAQVSERLAARFADESGADERGPDPSGFESAVERLVDALTASG